MNVSRRQAVVAGSSAFALVNMPKLAVAASQFDKEVIELTGGAPVAEGTVSLTVDPVAEDGNRVLVEVRAQGASQISILGDDNPLPRMLTAKFGRLNPNGFLSTRVRLARSQNVVVIAEMSDGSFQQAKTYVTVLVGGCGA